MRQAIHLALTPLLAAGLGARQPPPPPTQPTPKIDRTPVPGVGDILVAPQRLIFEGGMRTGELTLVNTGPRTASYRIYFTQMDMDEDGGMNEAKVKAKVGRHAEDIVRYSPRQVTLEPGITQAVRIALKKPEGLEAGEYRSHLVFRYVPEPEPAPEVDPKNPKPEGFSVRITALPGVAIPIVIRHGATSGQVAWEAAKITLAPAPVLEASLARRGNQSVYGDLRATFTPEGSLQSYTVLTMNWLAVYDPLPRRRFKLPLALPGGANAKGTLKLQFLAPETESLLAETRLEVR